MGGVVRDQRKRALRHRRVEDRAEQAVGLRPDRLPARRHGVVPLVDVRSLDLIDRHLAEGRIDEPLQQHPVLLTGRRSQFSATGLAGDQPLVAVLAKSALTVAIRTAHWRDRSRGRLCLGRPGPRRCVTARTTTSTRPSRETAQQHGVVGRSNFRLRDGSQSMRPARRLHSVSTPA